MYTITGIVLLIGVIVGHTQAYHRARDPSTICDQPKKVIDLPVTPSYRFYCMNVNDNGVIFLTGSNAVEIFDKQGNHVNTIPNDLNGPLHYEHYDRYGSVVTKDQLLILETFYSDNPLVTSVNEYTFTGQFIGTKFTVDESQVYVNGGRLGISSGKIILHGLNEVILINEDGSNPHRLEPPNKDDIPPGSQPFYVHPERGVYTVEPDLVTKIRIYDAASETVKDTITVSDELVFPNNIYVDDDGRIYFIAPFHIYILDASGNLIKQMDYNDGDITDIDIDPDGTLYVLNQFTGAILLY